MSNKNIILARRLLWLEFTGLLKSSPWPAYVFFLFCSLVFSGFLSLILFLNSPEGIHRATSFFDKRSEIAQIVEQKMIETSDKTTSVSDVSKDGKTSAPDLAVSKSMMKQAREIAEIVSPSDITPAQWITQLSNRRLTHQDMTVKIRPFHLSPLQERIFSIQGIKVIPWQDQEKVPKKIESISDPVFWISQTGPKMWTVHGSMADLLEKNKAERSDISNLDLLRVAVSAEELKIQEDWQKKNPPPEPPSDIRPSSIGVSIIPHPAALQLTFWVVIGFLALLVAGPALVLTVSAWESARREGRFEAIASLSSPAWLSVCSFILSRLGLIGIMLFVSCFISSSVFLILGLSLPFWPLAQICVIIMTLTLLVQSFGVMAVSWFSSRAWRLWVLLVFALAILALDVAYMVAFSDSRLVAIFFTSNWFFVAPVVALFLSFAFILRAGHRLSLHGKLGLRTF